MSRKLNLTKGQEVTVRYINDRIRYIKDISVSNIDEWTCTGEITKIGRKYIEVKMSVNGYLEKFEIEFDYVQKTNFGSPDYKLYLSKEEIINDIKSEEMFKKVRTYFQSYFNNGKFTLDQLQRIASIINENLPSE